jgi:hypothetical protein
MTIGVLNLCFAIVGFLDFLQVARTYHAGAVAARTMTAVWICNCVFNIFLLMAGIQLIRRRPEGRIFSACVFAVEIAYFLLFYGASLTAPKRIADAIETGFGVGGAGLTFQIFTLYPIWALIVLWIAKPRTTASHSSKTDVLDGWPTP